MVHALRARETIGAVPAISSWVMASSDVSCAMMDGFDQADVCSAVVNCALYVVLCCVLLLLCCQGLNILTG